VCSSQRFSTTETVSRPHEDLTSATRARSCARIDATRERYLLCTAARRSVSLSARGRLTSMPTGQSRGRRRPTAWWSIRGCSALPTPVKRVKGHAGRSASADTGEALLLSSNTNVSGAPVERHPRSSRQRVAHRAVSSTCSLVGSREDHTVAHLAGGPRSMGSPPGEQCFAAHARHAEPEMRSLALDAL